MQREEKMSIKSFFRGLFLDEFEIRKDKGDYIELLKIKESLFNFEMQRVRIPKSERKAIGFNEYQQIEKFK